MSLLKLSAGPKEGSVRRRRQGESVCPGQASSSDGSPHAPHEVAAAQQGLIKR